jgi:hypothetical protein
MFRRLILTVIAQLRDYENSCFAPDCYHITQELKIKMFVSHYPRQESLNNNLEATWTLINYVVWLPHYFGA